MSLKEGFDDLREGLENMANAKKQDKGEADARKIVGAYYFARGIAKVPIRHGKNKKKVESLPEDDITEQKKNSKPTPITETTSTTEKTAQKLGLSRKKEEKKKEYTPTPKQKESSDSKAKKLKVHKKGKKASKQKKNKGSAKKEIAVFIINNLINEGEIDPDGTGGVATLTGNVVKNKFTNFMKKSVRRIASAVRTLTIKLGKLLLKGLYILLGCILNLIWQIIVGLFALLGPVVFFIVVVIALVSAILGFFLRFVDDTIFVTDYIDNYCSAIMEETEEYDIVEYVYQDEYSNYDDILLIYLSKVNDADDFSDIMSEENGAPSFFIDKRKEEKALDGLLEDMFYLEEQEPRIELVEEMVTIIEQVEQIVYEYVYDENGNQVFDENGEPLMQPKMTELLDDKGNPVTDKDGNVVMIPVTEIVDVEREELVITEVEKTVIKVMQMSSSEWLAANSLNKKQRNVYELLSDYFYELGYSPASGNIICEYYNSLK